MRADLRTKPTEASNAVGIQTNASMKYTVALTIQGDNRSSRSSRSNVHIIHNNADNIQGNNGNSSGNKSSSGGSISSGYLYFLNT